MQATPHEPLSAWRLRPRDGQPRALVELVAQWGWRWRIEIGIAYLVAAVSALVIYETGIL